MLLRFLSDRVVGALLGQASLGPKSIRCANFLLFTLQRMQRRIESVEFCVSCVWSM